MRKEYSNRIVGVALCAVFIGLAASSALATPVPTNTVLTFEDPSPGGATPFFTINRQVNTIDAAWSDAQMNLNLQLWGAVTPSYFNAFFTMDQLTFNPVTGVTDVGRIRFFDNNATPIDQNALVIIDFYHALLVADQHVGSTEFLGHNVTITGTAIPWPLTNESFSFAFANQTDIGGDPANGFTATATFTSSAVIPEPLTLGLFAVGSILALRGKRPSNRC